MDIFGDKSNPQIKFETSNLDVKIIVTFLDDKWSYQISNQGIPQYPIIPSKVALLESNDSRDNKIVAAICRLGIEKDTAINMLYDVMAEAGKRKGELDLLQLGKSAAPTTLEEKYEDKIIERANYILTEGDPFKFYMDKWKSCYAITDGDDSLGAMTLCVVGSTVISNSKGLHEKVGGPSGYGKSAGVTRMFALFPPEKTLVSSMSAKSIFYKELPAGTVIYSDDVDLSKEDFFTTVKQSTSDYQQVTKHTTVSNGASVDCSVSPRIGWVLSAVDNFSDDQLDSRFGETEVHDDVDKQMAIHDKQKEEEFSMSEAGTIDEDTLVCRCMWDIIQSEGLYEIRIPFINAIKWSDIKHPRAFPFFKDMIRCMTLFRIRQREKVGKFYVATIADFERAKEVYKKMEKINATKLNSKELAIIEVLADRYKAFIQTMSSGQYSQEILATAGKVSRMDLVSQLSQKYNMKQQNIIDIIHGKKEEGGLLNKVVGLQAEKMQNNVFGGGSSLWWYWYTGAITKDGYADSITLDEVLAEREFEKWYKQFKPIPQI